MTRLETLKKYQIEVDSFEKEYQSTEYSSKILRSLNSLDSSLKGAIFYSERLQDLKATETMSDSLTAETISIRKDVDKKGRTKGEIWDTYVHSINLEELKTEEKIAKKELEACLKEARKEATKLKGIKNLKTYKI